jgi:uncharacterized membrane protein
MVDVRGATAETALNRQTRDRKVRRLRRGLTTVAVSLGTVLALATPALAAPAAVTVGASEVELEPADGGGGAASISLTNLTDELIAVTARPQTPRPQCAVTLDKGGQLGPARTTSLKATITSACGTIEDAFLFEVVPAGGRPLLVTAKPAATEKPDWDAIVWFVYCTGIALLLLLTVYVAWLVKSEDFLWPWESLPYLDDSWSFKDSWVSNVTVVGGLLAGIFGSSDVVKAMLGEDADGAVALATIGGAISIALIGAAGVLVIALKTLGGGKFTAGGVLLGSALALGAAGGQLVVVYESAKDLDLGGHEDDLTPFLIAAILLLVLYGFLSVLGVLIQGHKKPEDRDPAKAPVSETTFAAAVLAAAMRPDNPVTRAAVQQQIDALKAPGPPPAGAPPAEADQALDLRTLAAAPAYVSGRSALP